jgi:hypothetical protein
MTLRTLLVLAAALTLGACATAQRLDAANDVHALLVAIRDGDRATFDAHVDRPALQRAFEAKMAQEVERSDVDPRLKELGRLLSPTIANMAGDALLQPGAFRRVAEYYGYDPAKPLPGRVAIASALKSLPDGRVCATRTKDGPCLLIFTETAGVWKLSGFEGELSELRRS